jgi:Protein of unknown function (DUF3617)
MVPYVDVLEKRIMKKLLSLIAASALFVAGPACAQKPAAPAASAAASVSGATPMRAGLWETTVTIQTVGADSRRTIVSRACYAATDVTDVARVLPRQREPGMKCENRDPKVQGTKAAWQVACSSAEGSLAGPAELTFAATTYAGQAELERKKRGAKAEKVSATLSGKWLEACK